MLAEPDSVRDASERGDGVVLVGLPGSGKSAVGRRLAARLGREYVDTDDVVEQQTGLTAAEHNRRSGDA